MHLSIAEALKKTNWNIEQAVDLSGASRESVVTKLGKMRKGGKAPPAAVEERKPTKKEQEAARTGVEVDLGRDSGCVTTRSRDIRTLDAALREAKVDLAVWEVERHVVNSWEVTMGRRATASSKPETYTNFQVKVWLRRIRKTDAENSIEGLIGALNARAPSFKLPAPPKRGGVLMEVNLADPHFSMLAWGPETGESYDLKIASARYLSAVSDLLDKSKGYSPEKILFVFGNDFLHVDSEKAETPRSHNHLDKDGRIAKILQVAEEAAIRAIGACAQVAPVDVLFVPGNHDPLLSLALCRVFKAYFRSNEHVDVDVSPKTRKYYRYGASLLGFTHGCDERHGDLPAIMAAERPVDFGQVTTREFHLGHFHKRKQTNYLGVDSKMSVTVRIVPSLSSIDAWHFRQGYVGGQKMADAYLYDKAEGFVGHFTSTVRR